MPRESLPLVLASTSPRRKALLDAAGLRLEVIPPAVEEQAVPGEGPHDQVRRLAREKALDVARRFARGPRRIVVGADTLVVLGEAVLGKPRDPEHAVALLQSLLGRRHRVVTGVALVETDTFGVHELCVESAVVMRAGSEAEIRAYVAGGEPLDKAGGYAAQGEGRRFIDRIEGSESNVIGLPLDETLAALARLGHAGRARP
jgi:septum formation protein